jgi:hypothetical protein
MQVAERIILPALLKALSSVSDKAISRKTFRQSSYDSIKITIATALTNRIYVLKRAQYFIPTKEVKPQL